MRTHSHFCELIGWSIITGDQIIESSSNSPLRGVAVHGKMKAKIINEGDDQVILFPKRCRLRSQTVTIERVPQGLLIIDTVDTESRCAKEAASISRGDVRQHEHFGRSG